MALEEFEQRLWDRIEGEVTTAERPRGVVSTLTPFPFWVLVGSMLVPPLALILSFFARRQAVVGFDGEIAVYDVSFWRQRVEGERLRVPVGAGQSSIDGRRLLIGGERFHIEPGWRGAAERVIG